MEEPLKSIVSAVTGALLGMGGLYLFTIRGLEIEVAGLNRQMTLLQQAEDPLKKLIVLNKDPKGNQLLNADADRLSDISELLALDVPTLEARLKKIEARFVVNGDHTTLNVDQIGTVELTSDGSMKIAGDLRVQNTLRVRGNGDTFGAQISPTAIELMRYERVGDETGKQQVTIRVDHNGENTANQVVVRDLSGKKSIGLSVFTAGDDAGLRRVGWDDEQYFGFDSGDAFVKNKIPLD